MNRKLADLLDELLAYAKAAPSFLVELGPLTLSIEEAFEGEPVSTNIVGFTAGGRVSCALPDGLTFDRVARTIIGTAPVVGEYDIALRETHPQGSNSPRLSIVRFTSTTKPVIPVDEEPYAWGDPRLSWGQAGIAWGQAGPDPGATPAQKPALTLSGPASVSEGNPGDIPRPALTLSGPTSVTEGNPGDVAHPALTLSGPTSVSEGNPAAGSPALTLSGPTSVSEGS